MTAQRERRFATELERELYEALAACVIALDRATLGNPWDEVFIRSARAALAKADTIGEG